MKKRYKGFNRYNGKSKPKRKFGFKRKATQIKRYGASRGGIRL